MFDENAVADRLSQFGYTVNETDESAVSFAVKKTESSIKNICNITEVPDGLCCIAVDMAVGEFLSGKKIFSPGDIEGLDIDSAVKSIQTGDSTVQFDTASAAGTELDRFINYLMTYGKDEILDHRKLRW